MNPKIKNTLTLLWNNFLSIWYLPKWLYWIKPFICHLFGHKTFGKLTVYEQEKKKKVGDKMFFKHRYDPYMIYSCARCGKRLAVVRLRRKLKRDEAEEYSRIVKEKIKAFNEQQSSKQKK